MQTCQHTTQIHTVTFWPKQWDFESFSSFIFSVTCQHVWKWDPLKKGSKYLCIFLFARCSPLQLSVSLAYIIYSGFFSLLLSQKAESVHHFVFEWLTKHYSRSHFNVHFVIMRIMKLKNFRIWIYKGTCFDCLVILSIWTHGTLNYCFRVTIANKKYENW